MNKTNVSFALGALVGMCITAFAVIIVVAILLNDPLSFCRRGL